MARGTMCLFGPAKSRGGRGAPEVLSPTREIERAAEATRIRSTTTTQEAIHSR